MWVLDQTREQFLNTLQREALPSDLASAVDMRTLATHPPRGTMRIIWRHRPESGILPAVLVVSETDQRDFFAWVNTYLTGWRPITGLFRVVGSDAVQPVLETTFGPKVLWDYRNAALGMMVGEAATHAASASKDAPAAYSLPGTLHSTCSYVLGRAMSGGWGDLATVAKRWHRSHTLARHGSSDHDSRSLGEVASVLAEVAGLPVRAECGTPLASEAVVAICHGLHARDEVDATAFTALTRDWPDLQSAFQDMDGTRERRVQAFDLALRSAAGRRRSSHQIAVVALGLLASRIAPGSLDHTPLLIPHAHRLKSLLVWYGLFSGMTRASRLTDHYESLGRRVLRDMLVPDTPFSNPSCDIALNELETISASDSALQGVQRRSAEHLAVEILPCVSTVVPWLTDQARAGHEQGRLFDDEARRLESDVRDVNQAAQRLLRRLRRLRPGR